MAVLLLAVDFLGEWVETPECFTWISMTRETVPVILNHDVTYSELVNKIVTRCGGSHDPNDLCITYMLSICSKQKSHPCKIKNDEDLLVYLADVDGSGNRPTLRVCLAERSVEVSNEQPVRNDRMHDDCSASGWDDMDLPDPLNMEISATQGEEEGNVGASHEGGGGVGAEVELEEEEQEQEEEKEMEFSPTPVVESNTVMVGGLEAGCSVQRDGDDDGTDFYKGLTFKNKRVLINALQLAAVKKHYCFKKVKNTKKVFCVRCVHQSCKWWIRAIKYVDSDRFIITVYRNKHSCGLQHLSSDHPHASAELIGSYLKSSYEEGKGKGISIKDVKAAVRRDLGCNISYWKCRMGTVIAKALTRGTPEHSYAILDAYRYMLRTTNEGTHTALKVDDNQRFMYFFVALGAWITGFAHMRKVIAVDGTHLSGKYGGVLLSAMAQDSETHIFPVAFCVVNVECDASYDYFFENLVGILPSTDELCVVSDRHSSIPKAVSKYFPQANYGVCKWHLAESIRSKLHCGEFVSYFYKAAESYTPTDFEEHFQQIRSLCPRVATYLEQVGFERWSRAFFPGRRFGVMTSNIAESINAMLKDEREYPIVAMFNGILRNFSEKFHHRRTMFLQHSKPCVPSIEQILRKNVTEGNKLYVCCVGNDVYNVGTGDEVVSVDLIQRTCSCRRFDLDELPCAHAMAALRCRYGGSFEFGNEIYQYTSGYYSTNAYILAYDGLIYPMIAEELWNAPPELYERKIKPPFVKITRGRRKTKRMPSVGEAFTSRKNRCGICKRLGHKKTTCPQRRVVDSGGPSVVS